VGGTGNSSVADESEHSEIDEAASLALVLARSPARVNDLRRFRPRSVRGREVRVIAALSAVPLRLSTKPLVVDLVGRYSNPRFLEELGALDPVLHGK